VHVNYSIWGWVGASTNDPAQGVHALKSGPEQRSQHVTAAAAAAADQRWTTQSRPAGYRPNSRINNTLHAINYRGLRRRALARSRLYADSLEIIIRHVRTAQLATTTTSRIQLYACFLHLLAVITMLQKFPITVWATMHTVCIDLRCVPIPSLIKLILA